MINYTYKIELTIKDTNNSIYNYSNRIAFLTVLDDYENNINSAIKIGFFVTPEMYDRLTLRADEMSYSLTVICRENSARQNVLETNSEYFFESFKIKPVNMPHTIYKSENSQNNSDYIQVIMDFIPDTVLRYNRYMCNGIYSNVTVNDVILYLLNKMRTPVIYERPDNLVNYNQIILPPNNIFMSFKFLQQHYGIYRNGLSMWFNGDILCFKNRYNSNKTPKIYDDNLNLVRIMVNKQANENKNFYGEGTIRDLHDNYEYRTTLDKITINSNIITMEELYGNTHMTYSRNLKETYITDTELNYKANEDKLKLYWNGIENPTAVNQYFNELSNPVKFEVDYTTANLNMWSPLNRFRLQVSTNDITNDLYINKLFQVSRNEMFFNVKGGIASLQGKALLTEIGGTINVD